MKELMNNETVQSVIEACEQLDPEILNMLLSEDGMMLFEQMQRDPSWRGRGKMEWTDQEMDDVIARARRGERIVL